MVPIPMTDAPRTVGPPETGVLGVGWGAAEHMQLVLVVHEAFLQAASIHTRPETQSEFIVHLLLHDAGGGIGVGVGVGVIYTICCGWVGVGVSAGPGVGVLAGVGVGVGVPVGLTGVGVGVGFGFDPLPPDFVVTSHPVPLSPVP